MTAPDTLPPELAELGELLREDPPRPDPVWARELDDRAAAGFPRPPRRSRWARLKPRRALFLPAAGLTATAVIALVVVLGTTTPEGDFSSGSGGDSGAGAGGSSSAGTAESASPESARDSAPDEAANSTSLARPKSVPPAPGGGSPGSDARQTRKQERSAALTLAARPGEIEDVADGIVRVTDAAGGFVSSSSVSGGDGGSFELRIPTTRLQKAVADLSALAHVRERTQATRDITAESVSANEQLREARNEREGLLRALSRAVSVNETESIKARLRSVNAQIASARAAVRRVDNRARYANVSVSLVADRTAAAAEDEDDGRWTPADAFDDSVRVLEVAAGIAVIVLAIALPLGILVALAVVGGRVVGRRRRERALDIA